ncbi:MAG: hypothetical protein K2J64_09075 [Desulfovibrio sp.]|nr:hypothetical protein [Desulfovibrio sp.]
MNEELQRMIEQGIIEVLVERRKAMGISAEELGKRVFPGAANARMKVQTLTQKQGNGKPRSLKVGEFVNLSKALELDPVRVLSKVLEQFEETRI